MDANQYRRVLVVDDEQSIVNAVLRELNSPPFVHYHYTVEGFTDPVLALARAKEQSFDAVICDYRMPGIDGIEFLKALSEIQPGCARLVLSGQTDMAALIRMVNETHIYRFIPKPWHDYYLKGSLLQAIEYASLSSEHMRLAALVRENGILTAPLAERTVDHVLIVDDDTAVLNSLSRALTHHSRIDDLFSTIRSEVAHQPGPMLDEDMISVHVTSSPHHALKMTEDISFSCIVADYRMPEMNGIDLLQRFSDLQPDCERVLISGEIGEADLIYAVDSVHIFAFVDKPWTDFELKAQIALALSRRRMQIENRLLAEMVKRSGHLAPQ